MDSHCRHDSQFYCDDRIADGRLGETLFVVLAEPSGGLPNRDMFKTKNLHVTSARRHIMTKGHLQEFARHTLFDLMTPVNLLLLVDMWTPFRNHIAMQQEVPLGHQLYIRNIEIQPINVYFFSPLKNMFKKITAFTMHKSSPRRSSAYSTVITVKL